MILVGLHVLHHEVVRGHHGGGAVLVVGWDFEPDARDDQAAIEAMWFSIALTLPREIVEARVVELGCDEVRRRCGTPTSTFDAAARIHGITPDGAQAWLRQTRPPGRRERAAR